MLILADIGKKIEEKSGWRIVVLKKMELCICLFLRSLKKIVFLHLQIAFCVFANKVKINTL